MPRWFTFHVWVGVRKIARPSESIRPIRRKEGSKKESGRRKERSTLVHDESVCRMLGGAVLPKSKMDTGSIIQSTTWSLHDLAVIPRWFPIGFLSCGVQVGVRSYSCRFHVYWKGLHVASMLVFQKLAVNFYVCWPRSSLTNIMKIWKQGDLQSGNAFSNLFSEKST